MDQLPCIGDPSLLSLRPFCYDGTTTLDAGLTC